MSYIRGRAHGQRSKAKGDCRRVDLVGDRVSLGQGILERRSL